MSEHFGKIPKMTRFNHYHSAGYSVDGAAMFGWVIKWRHTQIMSYYTVTQHNLFCKLNFSNILIMLQSKVLYSFCSIDNNDLKQGLTNIFWKGQDNKYFRLCRPYGLSQLFESSHRQYTANRHDYVSIKLIKIHRFDLWTTVWWPFTWNIFKQQMYRFGHILI